MSQNRHHQVRGGVISLLGLFALLNPAVSAAQNDIDSMNAWATGVEELIRGPLDIDDPGLGYVTYGLEDDVIGAANGNTVDVVTLGDGGSITLSFDGLMHDGSGADFAVFENGFFSEWGLFAEFAFVEVSSDGVSFAEFDVVTTRTTSVYPFEEVDPADYAGFAGDVEAGFGTLFDLSDLVAHPLAISGDVDLGSIEYVRITDVIGDGSELDSLGSKIWDPYPTPFDVGGFDLDGVGVINVPEPGAGISLVVGAFALSLLDRRRRAD